MENSKSRWYSQLYVQVLIGIVIGAAIGYLQPQFGAKLQPFADGFIKLIKMLLAPIIFGTVVVGIAKMGSIKEVGRIGVKALLYIEILSTIALVIGLIVVNLVKPGQVQPGRERARRHHRLFPEYHPAHLPGCVFQWRDAASHPAVGADGCGAGANG